MRWKNGGGITYQVASPPESAGLADFDWRISFAEIDAGGPFSAFAGVDRVLVLVDGASMVLRIDGTRHALEPLQPLAFAGESATVCELPAGPTRDLNVMVRRGRLQARVEVERLEAAAGVPADGSDPLILVVLAGPLEVIDLDGTRARLESRDALASTGAPVLTVEGPGVVAVVRLVPTPQT